MNVTAFDSLPRSGNPQLLVNALAHVIDTYAGCDSAGLFADFFDSGCGNQLGIGDRLFAISVSSAIASDSYVELSQHILMALQQFDWEDRTITDSLAVLPDVLDTTLLSADALSAIDERWPATVTLVSPKT